MSFVAPGLLIAAVAVASGVIALHFLVARDPRTVPLPTARFIPDRPTRAESRLWRPSALLLLALRVALVLAVGAALAQPTLQVTRRSVARIVIIDRSRAVASIRDIADSARPLLSSGDVAVLFDSTATTVREHALDSLASLAPAPRRGSLSAAFIAALRSASHLRQTADSLELALISPLVDEEFDWATDSLRALWPGAIRLIRAPARIDSTPLPVIGLIARAGDPVRFALPSYPSRPVPEANVRLVRESLGTLDSSWVREGDRVLLYWPATLTASDPPPPSDEWSPRSTRDTVGAVVAADDVVVAPFERTMSLRDTAVAFNDSTSRVIARWVDGEPAAIEKALGGGCIRSVAIDVPSQGDLVLQTSFKRFVAALSEPCRGSARLRPVDDVRMASLAGSAHPRLVSRDDLVPAKSADSPLSKWLLVAGVLLAIAETILRRRVPSGGAQA